MPPAVLPRELCNDQPPQQQTVDPPPDSNSPPQVIISQSPDSPSQSPSIAEDASARIFGNYLGIFEAYLEISYLFQGSFCCMDFQQL